MGRKLASLDIGSNSTLCLIAEEVAPGVLSVVADETLITGLGRGLTPRGLHPDAKARVLEALHAYRALMDAHGVSAILAAATAAMRDASDGERFAREIREALHIPVEIISGEREAELTFLSIARTFPRPHPIAVIDIGGRSTELMYGWNGALTSRASLPIGSVSATEEFLEGDPVTPESVERLRAHIRALFAPHAPSEPGLELFGVAATVTTFAAMAWKLEAADSGQLQGRVLTLEVLEPLLQELIAQPVARRSDRVGLDPKRADVIVAGGLLLEAGLEVCGVDRLTVSSHGLRFGLLLESFPELAFQQDP